MPFGELLVEGVTGYVVPKTVLSGAISSLKGNPGSRSHIPWKMPFLCSVLTFTLRCGTVNSKSKISF